ncbi:hypothetical protein AGMMS49974_10080 [Deltaproteobacteria bacterium]|nr:hypothetical protein AGMMS49974_10080 [Deltaproteobacteria bacterium]
MFRDYCLSRVRLTLAELLDFEKEINGSVDSQSMFVAYNTMVRVDKDTSKYPPDLELYRHHADIFGTSVPSTGENGMSETMRIGWIGTDVMGWPGIS